MSARARPVALLVAIVLLSGGCATANRLLYGTPTVQEIDDLREQGQYARALTRLDWLRQALPDSVESAPLDSMETRIRQEAEAASRRSILDARERETVGDWQGASATLEDAYHRYPDSDTLAVARAEFESRRGDEDDEVAEWLALVRARGLLSELPLREELARVRFDDRQAHRRLQEIQDELKSLHPVLVAAAEKALAVDDTDAARDYLEVAGRIERTEMVDAVLLRVMEEEKAQAEDAGKLQQEEPPSAPTQQQQQEQRPPPATTAPSRRSSAQRAAQARLERLLSDTREALDRGELVRARDRVAIAIQLTPEGSEGAEEVLLLGKEVDDRITAEVKRLDEEARKAYVEGHFEQAAEGWKHALELTPDDAEIKQQYDRVQRVLENLRRLRGDPPPPPPTIPPGDPPPAS